MEEAVQKTAKHSFTPTLVTITLQILLWSSVAVLSLQIYLFAASAIDASLFLTDVLCIAAAGTSLLTIITHILVVRLRENVFSPWACKAVPFVKCICLFLSSTALLLWVASCGLGTILSLARQPTCRPAGSHAPEMWMEGRVCIIQRFALVASMLALLISFVLCLVYNISSDAFTAGLFGSRQRVCLSPSDFQRSPQVVRRSTLSFKCRSVTSLNPVSSPSRKEMQVDDKEPAGLGISSHRPPTDNTPLLSKSPSCSSAGSNRTLGYLPCQPQTAHVPCQPQTAYVPCQPQPVYVPCQPRPVYVPPVELPTIHSPRRVPTTLLTPPPLRRLRSEQSERRRPRGVSLASMSSSVYSRDTNEG